MPRLKGKQPTASSTPLYGAWTPVAAIALLAVGLRLLFFFQARGEPWFLGPTVDAAYYHGWAQRIAAGDLLSASEGVFLMNPGYPYFLALVYAVFGPSIQTVALLQYALGILSCVAIILLARRLFDDATALVAGALAASYGISIFYESMLLTACLINTLNLLALLSLVVGVKEKRQPLLLLAGALLGLSCLARPNLVLFVPMALSWVAWTDKRLDIKKMCLLGLPVVILLAPILIVNSRRGGTLMLTASAGINLYMGNNPEATGGHSKLAGISHEVSPFKKELTMRASRKAGRKLSLAEASKYWQTEAFRFAARHPGAFLRLLWRKFALFWNWYEIPANLSFYFARDQLRFLTFLPGFGLVAVAGLLGILLVIRSPPDGILLLLLYFLAHLLSNLLVFVLAEYRYPAATVLMLFAAHGMVDTVRMLWSRRYRSLGWRIVFVIVLGFFVFRAPPYDKTQDPTYVNLAIAHMDRGEHRKAILLLERDMERSVQAGKAPDIITLEHLGIAHCEIGDRRQCRRFFEDAKKKDPDEPRFWTNLGHIHAVDGETSEAITCYERALEISPDHEDARRAMGVLRRRTTPVSPGPGGADNLH